MRIAAVRRARRCPGCGSRSLVLTAQGLVCSKCGLVVDEMVFELDPAGHWIAEDEPRGPRGPAARRTSRHVMVSRVLSRIARSVGVSEVELAAAATPELVSMVGGEWDLMLRVTSLECFRKLVHRRRRRPREIAAALHILAAMAKYGVPPLPSLISMLYKIPRGRVKPLVRSVKACLEEAGEGGL